MPCTEDTERITESLTSPSCPQSLAFVVSAQQTSHPLPLIIYKDFSCSSGCGSGHHVHYWPITVAIPPGHNDWLLTQTRLIRIPLPPTMDHMKTPLPLRLPKATFPTTKKRPFCCGQERRYCGRDTELRDGRRGSEPSWCRTSSPSP